MRDLTQDCPTFTDPNDPGAHHRHIFSSQVATFRDLCFPHWNEGSMLTFTNNIVWDNNLVYLANSSKNSQQRFSVSHWRVAATLFWDLQVLGSSSFATYRLGDSESRIWRLVNILSQARFLLTFRTVTRHGCVRSLNHLNAVHRPSQVTGLCHSVFHTMNPNRYER